MPPDDATRLGHMLDAVEKVLGFTDGKHLEDFIREEQLHHACAYLLEILGEAADNVSAATQTRHGALPWRQMIGVRDRLIRACFDIDFEMVWKSITEDLPGLRDSLVEIVRRPS